MAMSFMWLLLTVTVTCMCASPRCRTSAAASLSFTDYCQKLCAWGRGGNLCHCNAVHFVGKRRDVDQQELGEGTHRHKQLAGQGFGSDDEEKLWDKDDDEEDDDVLRLDDKNSSTDDVGTKRSHDPGSSMLFRRRRPPAVILALRRLSGRHQDAEDTDQLRDSAKKGERHKSLVVEQPSDISTDGLITLNALTRKPMTFSLPHKTKQWQEFRKKASKSREFLSPIVGLLVFYVAE